MTEQDCDAMATYVRHCTPQDRSNDTSIGTGRNNRTRTDGDIAGGSTLQRQNNL